MTTPTGAPAYYPPQQPPKKKHTVRNVILILLGIFILIIGGCAALIGGVANEVDNAIEEQESEDAQPGGPDNPLDITPGQPFEVYGFSYQEGWALGDNGLGGLDVANLRFQNDRDDADSALVEIKVWVGNEVVASADCTSDQAAPGTIVGVSCLSGDDLPAQYDRVTINDTF